MVSLRVVSISAARCTALPGSVSRSVAGSVGGGSRSPGLSPQRLAGSPGPAAGGLDPRGLLG